MLLWQFQWQLSVCLFSRFLLSKSRKEFRFPMQRKKLRAKLLHSREFSPASRLCSLFFQVCFHSADICFRLQLLTLHVIRASTSVQKLPKLLKKSTRTFQTLLLLFRFVPLSVCSAQCSSCPSFIRSLSISTL